jgi:hypothetical protein
MILKDLLFTNDRNLNLNVLDLGVSTPLVFNVTRCSLLRHYFTTCFSLNDHLQVKMAIKVETCTEIVSKKGTTKPLNQI